MSRERLVTRVAKPKRPLRGPQAVADERLSIGARVTIEDLDLIATAAEILRVDRAVVVARGTVSYAVRVLREQARLLRQITDGRLRRALRRAQRTGQ